MTMPHLMNCSHSGDGWCLDCVKKLHSKNEWLTILFNQLRESWFISRLKRYAHEREWEEEDRAELRELDNASMKAQYDADTKALLLGKIRSVAPRCAADLGTK